MNKTKEIEETRQKYLKETIAKVNKAAKETAASWAGFRVENSETGLLCGFFENQDNERLNFYNTLRQLGFVSVNYAAPYRWKVKNEFCHVEYVEGDVYLSSL